MKYHNITHDDMANGDGLRVVLWVSGCEHHCRECQNPVTWDPEDGLEFDDAARDELFEQLRKPYISGLTLSGGDPLHPANRQSTLTLVQQVKREFTDKTIWLYTGYTWRQILTDESLRPILPYLDVLVDDRFVPELADKSYPWAGSTNQKIIDVQKSLKKGEVVLHESH